MNDQATPDMQFEIDLLRGELACMFSLLMSEQPLSVVELAQVSETPASIIARIQEGEAPPSLSMEGWARLATALGFRWHCIPVRIGEPGPEWTRQIAAIAGTDTAMGALERPSPEQMAARSEHLLQHVAEAHQCCRECGVRVGAMHAEGCPLGRPKESSGVVLPEHLPDLTQGGKIA